MRYVAYYRVSKPGKGNGSLGLEAQRDAVLRHIGQGELIAEYQDLGSATPKQFHKLTGLKDALAHAQREKATLVVARLDRLTRSVQFAMELTKSGLDIAVCDLPILDRHSILFVAAMAEREAELISQRTKEALAAAKARGVKLGNPGNLTPEVREARRRKDRADALKAYEGIWPTIAKLKGEGRSLREIAAWLNEMGQRTRSGAQFEAITVKRIIDRMEAEKHKL